jgi:hypothetical protein
MATPGLRSLGPHTKHPILSPTLKTISTAEARGKKRLFYKRLPKEFRRNGFDYRQIYREGALAIYQQTWKGNEDSAAFELIRDSARVSRSAGNLLSQPKCIQIRKPGAWMASRSQTKTRRLRNSGKFADDRFALDAPSAMARSKLRVD